MRVRRHSGLLVLLVQVLEQLFLLLQQGVYCGVGLIGRWWRVAADAHEFAELGSHLAVVVLSKGHLLPHLGTRRVGLWLGCLLFCSHFVLLGFLPEELALLHLLRVLQGIDGRWVVVAGQ